MAEDPDHTGPTAPEVLDAEPVQLGLDELRRAVLLHGQLRVGVQVLVHLEHPLAQFDGDLRDGGLGGG